MTDPFTGVDPRLAACAGQYHFDGIDGIIAATAGSLEALVPDRQPLECLSCSFSSGRSHHGGFFARPELG